MQWLLKSNKKLIILDKYKQKIKFNENKMISYSKGIIDLTIIVYTPIIERNVLKCLQIFFFFDPINLLYNSQRLEEKTFNAY